MRCLGGVASSAERSHQPFALRQVRHLFINKKAMIYANPVHKKDIFILQKATKYANPNKKRGLSNIVFKNIFSNLFLRKGAGKLRY